VEQLLRLLSEINDWRGLDLDQAHAAKAHALGTAKNSAEGGKQSKAKQSG
jgi:hypothetical protein